MSASKNSCCGDITRFGSVFCGQFNWQFFIKSCHNTDIRIYHRTVLCLCIVWSLRCACVNRLRNKNARNSFCFSMNHDLSFYFRFSSIVCGTKITQLNLPFSVVFFSIIMRPTQFQFQFHEDKRSAHYTIIEILNYSPRWCWLGNFGFAISFPNLSARAYWSILCDI